MNARKRAILNAIERGPQNAATLATLSGAPQASVRRLVQSLRNEGHDISYAFVEEGGLYRYTAPLNSDGDEMGTDNFGDDTDLGTDLDGNQL